MYMCVRDRSRKRATCYMTVELSHARDTALATETAQSETAQSETDQSETDQSETNQRETAQRARPA